MFLEKKNYSNSRVKGSNEFIFTFVCHEKVVNFKNLRDPMIMADV